MRHLQGSTSPSTAAVLTSLLYKDLVLSLSIDVLNYSAKLTKWTLHSVTRIEPAWQRTMVCVFPKGFPLFLGPQQLEVNVHTVALAEELYMLCLAAGLHIDRDLFDKVCVLALHDFPVVDVEKKKILETMALAIATRGQLISLFHNERFDH